MRWMGLCLVLIACTDETVLFRHDGATNPVLEGWQFAADRDVLTGPIDDAGTPAWFVDDDSLPDGLTYTQVLTQERADQARREGWRLTAVLRVVEFPDAPDFAITIAFYDGASEWALRLGADESGDPLVRLNSTLVPGGSTVFGVPGGRDRYVRYEMAYEPGTDTVDVLVDGVERLSDWPGDPSPGHRVDTSWGSAARNKTGHARWNLVEFAVVEPNPFADLLPAPR